MALVTTTASLIRQYNAFTGLSAVQRSQSGIARAEIVYYNVNDTWAAPGATNYRQYQSGQISLPADFGYVVTDAFISVDASNDDVYAEMVGGLRIFPGGILGPQLNLNLQALPSKQGATGTTANGDIPASQYNSSLPLFGDQGRVIYRLVDKPTAILYPFAANAYTTASNPQTLFEFAIGERYVNGPAYDVNTYIRFLQYDIDQSYNYVIQSPQLTR